MRGLYRCDAPQQAADLVEVKRHMLQSAEKLAFDAFQFMIALFHAMNFSSDAHFKKQISLNSQTHIITF